MSLKLNGSKLRRGAKPHSKKSEAVAVHVETAVCLTVLRVNVEYLLKVEQTPIFYFFQ